jgi:hypothetical protein
VAWCGCGAVLYANSSRARKLGGRNHFYTCSARCTSWKKSIRAELLEEIVTDALLKYAGKCEITIRKVIPGDDHSRTLSSLGTQIANLTADHYVHGGVDDFDVKLASLAAEHARVSSLAPEKDDVQEIPAGMTFGEKWNSMMDGGERHAYLIGAGVRCWVSRDLGGDVLPTPDFRFADSPVRLAIGQGWRVEVHLGSLAELKRRSRASR